MNNIKMSSEAYGEFKDYLITNGTDDFSFMDDFGNKKYGVRLAFIGIGWDGPIIDISVGDKEGNDMVETMEDIYIYYKAELVEEFGSIAILSANENNGRYIAIKPVSMIKKNWYKYFKVCW